VNSAESSRLRGRRPFLDEPGFEDLVIFAEYFDGDTGRWLGATHQGWTGLVADPIMRAG
jgi:hypothetical protein